MASDTELMLQELDGLKDTVSSVYRDRIRKARETADDGDTRLCPYCGKEISAGAKVCPECGSHLEADEAESVAEKQRRRRVFDEGLTRR
jgi:predicted amidophosphoribosyltransferase